MNSNWHLWNLGFVRVALAVIAHPDTAYTSPQHNGPCYTIVVEPTCLHIVISRPHRTPGLVIITSIARNSTVFFSLTSRFLIGYHTESSEEFMPCFFYPSLSSDDTNNITHFGSACDFCIAFFRPVRGRRNLQGR